MTRKALLTVSLFFFCLQSSNGAPYTYDYNDNCRKIYQCYLSLHPTEGNKLLINEIKANPYNLMDTYLADYEDCILLLLNCDKTDYDQRIGHLQERINLLDKGDPASPWHRLCKAGIYLHWAIAELRFGEQYKAVLNFKRSYSLLKENQRLFPHFEYNIIFTGLEDAVVGSLPGNYKWLAAIFGMKGDVKKGAQELAAFINTHTDKQPLYEETVLYYLYIRFYLLSEQKEVWEYLNSPQFSVKDNLLNTFVKVNIALDYHQSDAALETLKLAATNQDFNRYPVFDLQEGMALLTRTDSNCVNYFIQYLHKNKSDIYIKDTWQKMAFAWYVNNNMVKATYCMNEIQKQGSARLDADKQAKRFAENNIWPLRSLLQARLLIDGGYYDRALSILRQVKDADLINPADKAEYYFRLGRVYEETAMGSNMAQNTKQAISYYRSAINTGKDGHGQFAARAALQTGKIYERLAMKNEAINMYKQCLDLPSHDFQNSIDQQAKAGINRLSGE